MSEAKILVVDDDLATRLIVSEALLGSDFEVVEAEDGVAALTMFEEHAPDAVLLDINMPNLDGYDVCSEIRQRFGNSNVPIMVMTASDDLDSVERAFSVGATDFMTKPVNLPLLAYRMRYMLRSAHTTELMREITRRLVHVQALARVVHWHVDLAGQFEWVNDPFATLWPEGTGTPPASIVDLVHPDDRARVAAALATRGEHRLEFRVVLPDGSERMIEQHAAPGDVRLGLALFGASQDVTDRVRAEQRVAQVAFYDELTGIPNRRLIESYLERGAEVARFAIAIELGLEHVDGLSEPARDELIRGAAERVIERVRGNDLALRLDADPRPVEAFGATMVARTRPDELLVVASGTNAAAVAHAIGASLGLPFAIGDRDLELPVRIGYAVYPEVVPRLAELGDAARAAMHEGGDAIVSYTAALRARRTRAAAIARSLDLALACAHHGPCDAITVRYEARADPSTGAAVGRRALPAFDRDLRDDIGAILAAEPALATRVLMWTLARAIGEAASWPAPLRLAASVSCVQLAATGGFQLMEQALAATGFDPARLDLELLDLPDTCDLDAAVVVFTRLRQRGIGIALRVDDDTPLQALHRLPLSYLRIDRGALSPVLVPAVVALAGALDLRVTITGVDTAPQRMTIRALDPVEASGLQFERDPSLDGLTADTNLQVAAR